MAKKTVVRRLYKYLPRSGGSTVVDQAIEADDAQYSATTNQLLLIEDLLRTANISPEVSRKMSQELLNYSRAEAETAIEYLRENQIESNDPRKQNVVRNKV